MRRYPARHMLRVEGRWRRSRQRPSVAVVLGAATSIAVIGLGGALGQVPVTLNGGAPVQVRPYVPEPGVPAFTVPLGTPNPFPGGGTDGGGYTSASGGGADPLTTMMSQSWGVAAVSNAQAMGVNATAVAATCVLESGCQNVGGTGTITGAFQMTAATYTQMINKAVAENPSLPSQIVPGIAGQRDPTTQAIAAAQYIKDGATALQNVNIENPTVLDVRGYFNFGPTGGTALAQASDSQPISQVLSMYSADQLRRNSISTGETVGQWRAAVVGKIGNAASQSVLVN